MCQDQGKFQKWRSVSFKSRAELSSKIELSSVLSEIFYVRIELSSRSALSAEKLGSGLVDAEDHPLVLRNWE